MGGFGSGRWRHGKNTTDDYQALDVRELQRDGLLLPGRTLSAQWTCNGKAIAFINVEVESDHVVLKYNYKRLDGTWQPITYIVNINWTPCNYGGQRPWFICPMGGCGQRVAILYGSSIFACRHCHQLAYQTQRETVDNRALRRAQNIRKKLGGSANMLEPFPVKPKGMRWHTYFRMTDQHYAFHRVAFVGIAKQFGIKIDI
jgi:hypothetical protein